MEKSKEKSDLLHFNFYIVNKTTNLSSQVYKILNYK